MYSKKVTMCDTFSFLNCATNQKIAITRLANATDHQTKHHLIAKMVIAMLKCHRFCPNPVLLYSDT